MYITEYKSAGDGVEGQRVPARRRAAAAIIMYITKQSYIMYITEYKSAGDGVEGQRVPARRRAAAAPLGPRQRRLPRDPRQGAAIIIIYNYGLG